MDNHEQMHFLQLSLLTDDWWLIYREKDILIRHYIAQG